MTTTFSSHTRVFDHYHWDRYKPVYIGNEGVFIKFLQNQVGDVKTVWDLVVIHRMEYPNSGRTSRNILGEAPRHTDYHVAETIFDCLDSIELSEFIKAYRFLKNHHYVTGILQ